MKNEKENMENEDFTRWIQMEANSGDDNLEDKIMDKILQQHSMPVAKRKTRSLSLKTITIGYSILALVLLTWCLFDNNIHEYWDLFNSKGELTGVHVKYNWMIIASGTLSMLFLLVHWMYAGGIHMILTRRK